MQRTTHHGVYNTNRWILNIREHSRKDGGGIMIVRARSPGCLLSHNVKYIYIRETVSMKSQAIFTAVVK